jgi:hypothetical protein
MSWGDVAPRGFQCCFCGGNVPVDDPCLIHLVLLGQGDSSQELWGHAECLRRVIHPSIWLLLPEECEEQITENEGQP